ncbi:MBL fold metallo-hydrolase [Chloroflexota bacterium]
MKEPFRIWEDVYMVGSAELSHPYDCCVYLLDAGDLVLIDSGSGESFDTLVSNIENLGFDPKRLKFVLATHAHIDHIGSLYKFRDVFGVQTIAHELDAEAIERGAGVGAEAYGVGYMPCHIDLRIQGSEYVLKLERYELGIIHIPGHTPGSIAAYTDMADRRILFGQDIHGPYYPHWGADPKQAKMSLEKLVGLKADILCEGHFEIYQPAAAVEKYIRQYISGL